MINNENDQVKMNGMPTMEVGVALPAAIIPQEGCEVSCRRTIY
jgi:hypothetical protein